MNYQELQQLSEADLAAKMADLRGEYYTHRHDVAVGKETNSARLRQFRQDIARVRTALKEKRAKSGA